MDNENATCKSFPGHPEDCDAINIVRRVFGAISCIGCIFVIFVIWVFRRYTAFSQRLILMLSIAAFLNGLGRMFQDSANEHGPWCTFQAFWLTFFNYAVMLWVVCITFNLFMNVIKGIVTTRFELWYHVVCWSLSFGISLLPFIGNHYGPSGSWCWIVKDTAWHMGIWYVPLFVVIISLIVIYSYILYVLYRQTSNWRGTFDPETKREQELLKEDIKPLRLYPFVYLVLSIFPLINRIQNAASHGEHVFGLVLMHAMTASLQGAAYSLVFAIDKNTLKSLTPTQIKAALLKKNAQPAVVQEYSVAVIHNEESPDLVMTVPGDKIAADSEV